jgi:hypothetical protein
VSSASRAAASFSAGVARPASISLRYVASA